MTEEINVKALERVNALVAVGMDYKDSAWMIALDMLLDFTELVKAFEQQEEKC